MSARFVVPGRAVPWKTHGHPRPILRRWQRIVAKAAMIGFHHGQRPYQGPIKLEITVCFCSSKKIHGDLTNLVKAIEDAMQGIVFLNDRQVMRIESEIEFADIAPHEQDVEVEVYSFGSRNP
jgi:Holliday junction resolvase RusA-like endonuclease